MARARITSKGQITIPKEIREQMGVGPGDSLDFYVLDGHFEVRPVKRRTFEEFRGIFHVERALPFEEERRIAHAALAERVLRVDDPTDA